MVNVYNRPTRLTGTVSNVADLAPGDFLLINSQGTSQDIGGVDLDTPALTVNGLNMGGADNLKTAINVQTGTTNVSASLTTLYEGGATTAGGVPTTITFDLNGVGVTVNTSGANQQQVALDTAAAINVVRD